MLARLLVPADFGLVAAALVVIGYVQVLQDFGLTTSLIQRQDRLDEAYDSAFLLVLAIAVVEAGVVILVSGPASAFFGDARLALVLNVMAGTILLGGLSSVPFAILHKSLKVRFAARIQMIAATVNIAVSVGMAIAQFSYWSIVAGLLCGTIVGVLLAWNAVEWRPHRRWSRSVARALVSFGALVTIESALYLVSMNFDSLVVGRVFGIAALGIYTVAIGLGNYPNSIVSGLVSRVIFPVYSLVSSDMEKLRKTYVTTFHYVSLLSIPAAVGILALSGNLVLTLLGSKWEPVIPLLQVLVLNGLFLSLGIGAEEVIVALGRPGLAAKIEGAAVAIRVVTVLPAAFIAGLPGVTLAVVVSSLTTLIMQLWIVSSQLSLGRLAQLRTAWASTAASAIMFVALVLLTRAIGTISSGTGPTGSVLVLVLLVSVGLVTQFVALAALTRGRVLTEIRSAVRLAVSLVRKAEPSAAGE